MRLLGEAHDIALIAPVVEDGQHVAATDIGNTVDEVCRCTIDQLGAGAQVQQAPLQNAGQEPAEAPAEAE